MNIPHCREFQYEFADIKIAQKYPHTNPHAPSEGSARVEARGNACHRLLGLLTGSALTGSGIDRAGQHPGRVVDRVRSTSGSGR